ncbi:salicylate hydroxylase [Lampropedia hyalina DSM 16112]|jgi:salicylate hydroxylase|uniref:Salicylate hydroxylase n=1 Tax=Lampropedia hyalina DSM 16112 TaxID=1122156 RepID=A0A1M5CB54_9BURK|nr:FAD-dependent monooxygenase [Lampropedia hyalina]SHF51930.1 salicylate hydroxylase [Lampropedia hyalina DSM 16112]
MDTAHSLTIAGAGIGGLSAALAASQAGWQVQLLEQAATLAEVGAGIQLGPNAWHCLRHWHLEAALREWAAFPTGIETRSARSHRLLARLPLGQDMERRYGAPYASIHRGDLHRLLLEQVQQHSDCRLRLGVRAHAFAIDGHRIAVQDEAQQTLAEADALLVADGVWSRLREQLLHDGPARPTGHCAYRGLIAQSALPASLRSQCVTAWMGQDMHAVLYPVRGGEWLNMVVIFALPEILPRLLTQSASGAAAQCWDMQAPQAQLEQLLHTACTPLQDLVQAISDHGTAHGGAPWRMWPLAGRPPVQHAGQMAQGRVALLGDAAHPMLPYLAQGAAMAIEDARQLQQSLTQPGLPDVPARLHHYAQHRWQRNARVQQQSRRNGRIFHLGGPVRLGRDLALTLAGPRLMDSPWLYGYGFVAHADATPA